MLLSCVTIAAALAAQAHVMLAAEGLTTASPSRFGRDAPALMLWDRTPPSPGSVCIPLQWWGLIHGSTGDVSSILSKEGDLQLVLKFRVCLSPFWGFWTGLIPQAANPAAHWVVLQSWALHSPVPSF